jgi:hypothetical protein
MNGKMKKLAQQAFDVLCDWKKESPVEIGEHTLETKQQKRAFVNASIQCFLTKPSFKLNDGVGKARIQAFNGSSSMPDVTGNGVWSTTIEAREYDMNWSLSFRTMELLRLQGGGKSRYWNIATGRNGVFMEKIPEGGKVKIGGFTGESAQVKVERYGSGFGLTWEMRNDRDFNAFMDAILSTQAELFGTWADVHYAILKAAADQTATVTYDTVGATQLEKDINTVNKMVAQLANTNKGKGYGDVSARMLNLYFPLDLEARMRAVQKATITKQNDRVTELAYNVRYLRTLNSNLLSGTGTAAQQGQEATLVLPGEKLQNAVHTQELGLTDKDIESDSDIHVKWTAFGAAAGDSDQVLRGKFYT